VPSSILRRMSHYHHQSSSAADTPSRERSTVWERRTNMWCDLGARGPEFIMLMFHKSRRWPSCISVPWECFRAVDAASKHSAPRLIMCMRWLYIRINKMHVGATVGNWLGAPTHAQSVFYSAHTLFISPVRLDVGQKGARDFSFTMFFNLKWDVH
jgi:hypothetical protein